MSTTTTKKKTTRKTRRRAPLHPDPAVPVTHIASAPLPPPVTAPAFKPVDRRSRPMSAEEWSGSEVMKAELAQLLNHPTFQSAVATLKEIYLPTAPPSVTVKGGLTDPNLAQNLAFRWMHRTGFYSFDKALFALAESRPTPNQQMIDWGELMKEPE